MALRGLTGHFILFISAFLFVACSGSDSAAPAVEPSPTAVVTPTAVAVAPSPTPGPVTPDGERILADVRYLSETLGPRPAGSASEKAAADYIADRLRGLGYDVRFQEFPASGSESGRQSSLVLGAGITVPTLPFERSATGNAKASLVAAGNGKSGDFPAEARGAVVLIARDQVTPFSTMVANARTAGAKGVIIFNNDSGLFYGTLAEPSGIPTISIARTEGDSLLASLQKGPVEVEISVGAVASVVSRNVVATPPDGACETVSGGHYDSVPQAPGASDNATGTATVLEIASVMAKTGKMEGNCFVLFGAEELGLIGSRAYVSGLDTASRGNLKAMLNFDMVGVGSDGWALIGTADLQTRAQGLATGLGIVTQRSSLPNTTSSDHASFINAGIPSIMFYRMTDNLLHTPQDVIAGRVQPDLLEQAARMGVAFLQSVNGGA